ncbi:MAG: UDP-N-acetylmuramate dehydrogenase [Candidatus Eisenbacteria sp.]|nr:UDP-N-acetylmuramate dehydrogenase [Candidatus Eisenbacteria bacterium]
MTRLPPNRWQRNVPLARLTTWRIGGPARFLAHPRNAAELVADLAAARHLGLPVFALGAGSNLLFADTGYPGLLIRLRGGPPRDADGTLLARMPPQRGGPARVVLLASGTPLPRLVRQLARLGWGGLEWAGGIPGTVGGAIINNAGAYGGQIGDFLESVDLLDGDGSPATMAAAELGLSYRHSRLKGCAATTLFVLQARVRLTPTAPDTIAARCAELRAKRRARTPRGPSCGSVFRNPPGDSAGRLIDAAGLRGTRIGDSQVAYRHANYIINKGAATAEQVVALIDVVRRRVWVCFGVALEPEVQLVGLRLDPLPRGDLPI